MKKRPFELRDRKGNVLISFMAQDSEDALDIIFDQYLYDVEAENEPMTLEEHRDNEADAHHKECA
jgi:hypothetical protein